MKTFIKNKFLTPIHIFTYITIVLLWFINDRVNNETVTFYGVVTNKETEINTKENVKINEVFVNTGDHVKAGDLLLTATHIELEKELKNNSLALEGLSLEKQDGQTLYNQQEQTLRLTLNQQLKQLDLQISQLKKDKKFQIEALEKIIGEDSKNLNYSEINHQLDILYQQKRLLNQKFNTDLKQIRQTALQSKELISTREEIIKNDINLISSKMKQLEIRTPIDGVVGTILCKQGENTSAFDTLLTIYEPHPSIVKGFIHEDIRLNLQKNDTLLVSTFDEETFLCNGDVKSIGQRIIEIPERLRKFPEIKTYGKELTITIPENNRFSLNEKVIISIE
ncbi:hypothetical protein UJ101_01467 [Flavobacteriaceae bacterium UJ101]|nr:hypothetical protein UJ101_01467 [Flavobacteriaceae bacterium UJ101]